MNRAVAGQSLSPITAANYTRDLTEFTQLAGPDTILDDLTAETLDTIFVTSPPRNPHTRGTQSANTAHLSLVTTGPDRHSESNSPRGKRVKRKPSVDIIREHNALQHGEKLHLKPGSLNQHTKEAVLAWANQNPDWLIATWNTTGKPLTWQANGHTCTPTGLVQHLITEATGQTGIPVTGALWWVNESGKSLYHVANEHV